MPSEGLRPRLATLVDTVHCTGIWPNNSLMTQLTALDWVEYTVLVAGVIVAAAKVLYIDQLN